MKDLLENKKQLLSIIGTLIISVIALLIVSFTYAYFAPIISEAFGNVIVDNGAVDELKFDPGDPLSFMVTEYTLPQNGGNLVKETHPKATLTANSDNNTATYDYYIYFKIENNTFVYSDGSTPEIILTILDYNGNEITSIEGLTYGTYDGVTGFDITTKNDIYEIAHPTISSTSSTNATIQEYTFKITYLNKSYDQLVNIGNKMDVTVLMRKNEMEFAYHEKCNEDLFACKVAKQFQSNTSNTNGLYYHDGTITRKKTQRDPETGERVQVTIVLDAEDKSYRFSGGDYKLTDLGEYYYNGNITDISSKYLTALVDFYCNNTKEYAGHLCANAYTRYYKLGYNSSTQYSSFQAALNKAVTDGYITQDNVKNFVCFGTDDESCGSEYLYRIIGVFDGRVKLIKYTLAKSNVLGNTTISTDFSGNLNAYYSSGSITNPTSQDLYYWNSDNSTTTYNETGYYNVWSYSKLNTAHLNGYYLNTYLNSTWANKIYEATWYLNSGEENLTVRKTEKDIYNAELGEDAQNATGTFAPYTAKIGLMYASDYAYAHDPSQWNKNQYRYEGKDYNWMYNGGWDEWTISRNATYNSVLFTIQAKSGLDVGYYSDSAAVRPVFYLNSNVRYVDGSGTQSDPYRIN